jgi:hypothetical protein
MRLIERRSRGQVPFCSRKDSPTGFKSPDSCYKNNADEILCKFRRLRDKQFASQGEALISPSGGKIRPLLALFLALLTACAAAAPALAQEKKVAQKNGVDISKMGAYRALAQHIYTEFQRGDIAAAAELGTVLERVWDKAEEYGGDTALAKTNRQLFDEIDKAMDQFITPITDAKGKPPDPAKVKAAYSAYLEKLKLAD